MVAAVLAGLARAGHDYAVAGRPDVDEAETLTGDVDVFIHPATAKEIVRLVHELCCELGYTVAAVHRHQHHGTSFYIFDLNAAGACGICLDFYSDFYFEDRRLMTAAEVFPTDSQAPAAAHGPIKFLPDGVNAAYYLLKKVAKGEASPAQFDLLRELHAQSGSLPRLLTTIWSEQTQAEIDAVLAGGDHRAFCDLLPRLKADLIRSRPLRWRDRLWGWRRMAARLLRKGGFMVAVLGPDGVGKSTVIAEFLERPSFLFVRSRYQHLRPKLFIKRKAGVTVTDPHAAKPYGALASLGKLAYLLFDFTAGYLLKTLPELRRTTLLVSDRYYQDLLVDPRRYRYGGPLRLAERCECLVPQPDLLVVLDAPAAVIQARKQEVAFGETERQVQAYRALVGRRRPFASLVDADQPPERVRLEIQRLIVARLAERTAKRFRWAGA